MPHLEVLDTPSAVTERALEVFLTTVEEAVQKQGRCSVALCGGSTPQALYAQLALRSDVPWEKVHFFFGDDRYVPYDHPNSNYRMVQEVLFSKAPIPPENIHPIPVGKTAEEDAQAYAATLADYFRPEPPRFDLILLGMGNDGHTASLFPGDESLEATGVVTVAHPRLSEEAIATAPVRLTFTFSTLNQAHKVLFLITGKAKQKILAQVLKGAGDFPAGRVRPLGELLFIIDRAASSASD
ncbi:MAG: 6-phosphogluconolactonase [Gloeobacterales cyanobacterium]